MSVNPEATTFLSSLICQECRIVGDPKAEKGGVGAKRVRPTQGEEDPGTMWEWQWAPGHMARLGRRTWLGERGLERKKGTAVMVGCIIAGTGGVSSDGEPESSMFGMSPEWRK